MFHRIVVHDPRVLYNLDRRSYRCTVHTYPKPCPGHNSSLLCWIIYITQSSKFTHGKNLFPDHYLSRVTWMGMILNTIVVHDPVVVVAGGIFPSRTCFTPGLSNVAVWNMIFLLEQYGRFKLLLRQCTRVFAYILLVLHKCHDGIIFQGRKVAHVENDSLGR